MSHVNLKKIKNQTKCLMPVHCTYLFVDGLRKLTRRDLLRAGKQHCDPIGQLLQHGGDRRGDGDAFEEAVDDVNGRNDCRQQPGCGGVLQSKMAADVDLENAKP